MTDTVAGRREGTRLMIGSILTGLAIAAVFWTAWALARALEILH